MPIVIRELRLDARKNIRCVPKLDEARRNLHSRGNEGQVLADVNLTAESWTASLRRDPLWISNFTEEAKLRARVTLKYLEIAASLQRVPGDTRS